MSGDVENVKSGQAGGVDEEKEILAKDVTQDNLCRYLKKEGFDDWEAVQDMTLVRIVKASESQLDDALKARKIDDGLIRSDYIAAIKQLPGWIKNHPNQSGMYHLCDLFFSFVCVSVFAFCFISLVCLFLHNK